MQRVKFVIFQNEVLALFVDVIENNDCILSYAHNGQHSVANKTLKRCKRATIEQYANLKRELESVHYNIIVV